MAPKGVDEEEDEVEEEEEEEAVNVGEAVNLLLSPRLSNLSFSSLLVVSSLLSFLSL